MAVTILAITARASRNGAAPTPPTEAIYRPQHGRKKAGVVDHIGCEWFVKRVIVTSGRGEAAALWHQRVTARFGDQDGRAGGVFLDLLPQPVDVRLERVSGEPGIVAPDLLQ